jgi:hypothetical protein
VLHAGTRLIDGDSEQRNVPDPNGHTEVVGEEPLQNEFAGHGVKLWKNEHESFGDIFCFSSTMARSIC